MPAPAGFPQPGSLESLAAGPVLERLGAEQGYASGVEVVTAALGGDPKARELIELIGRRLGIGIANAINTFDPDEVVLGGGVAARAGELLLEPARTTALGFVLPGVGEATEIRLARHGAGCGRAGRSPAGGPRAGRGHRGGGGPGPGTQDRAAHGARARRDARAPPLSGRRSLDTPRMSSFERGPKRPGEHGQDERELVARLRDGDEAAFATLVQMYSPALLRLARMYVSTGAVAEEVVQETWLGVLKGLDRFEQRSSLKTWIFRILVNTAKTRGQREARSIPFSSTAPGAPATSPPSTPTASCRPSTRNGPGTGRSAPRAGRPRRTGFSRERRCG